MTPSDPTTRLIVEAAKERFPRCTVYQSLQCNDPNIADWCDPCVVRLLRQELETAQAARRQAEQERDAAQKAMSYASNQAHLEWTRAEKSEAEKTALRSSVASLRAALELKAELQAYDRIHGRYPEHEYEGYAIWRWLTRAPGEPFVDVLDEWHEEEARWIEDVEAKPDQDRDGETPR